MLKNEAVEKIEKLSDKLKNIFGEIIKIELDCIEEERRHKNKLAELNAAKVNIQVTCPHSIIQHYPDASGNNDSSDECQICGKVW